ncbi:MAG: hypothetical protein QM765_36895 [Myxococcales bacterium]
MGDRTGPEYALKDIDGGSFWDPYHKTLEEAPDAARRFVGMMRQ